MDYNVASVDEALGLLILVAQQPGLGVTELSKRSGITKARAFRLLCTLEGKGFVQRLGEVASYHLGYKSLLVGLAAEEQVSLVRQASKYLQALAGQLNEVVQIRVRDGFDSVCLGRWDSTHDVRIHGSVGMKRPLHGGASGKLLLAYAPQPFLDEFFAQDLPKFTATTITQRTKMTQELARIRAQGFATSVGEIAAEVLSVAAPVRDGSGDVIAAMGVSIPKSRGNADTLLKVSKPLRQAADRLSADLGYKSPVTHD